MTRDALARQIDDVMTAETDRFAATIPHADELTGLERPLDTSYYLRHRIETVRRIRMTGRIDALALASMVAEDYDASKPWAKYIAEELTHDRLYLEDLRRHGVDEAMVLVVPPFKATLALEAYLCRRVAESGSIGAVAYSIYAEWSSARYSEMVVRKAERTFGAACVRGSRAHLGIDESEDHFAMILDVAWRVLRHRRDDALLSTLLREIGVLLRLYYCELSDAIFPGDARRSDHRSVDSAQREAGVRRLPRQAGDQGHRGWRSGQR